jgi:hypothetical protein
MSPGPAGRCRRRRAAPTARCTASGGGARGRRAQGRAPRAWGSACGRRRWTGQRRRGRRAAAAAGPADRRAGGPARALRDEHAARRSSRPSPTIQRTQFGGWPWPPTTRCTWRAARAAGGAVRAPGTPHNARPTSRSACSPTFPPPVPPVLHRAKATSMARPSARPGRQRHLDDASRERCWRATPPPSCTRTVSTPCLAPIARAEGLWIEDLRGRRYHGFPRQQRAPPGSWPSRRCWPPSSRQLDELSFAPRRFAPLRAVELAEALGERFRALTGQPARLLFTTGGSDAVEVALKLARAATGRFKTI